MVHPWRPTTEEFDTALENAKSRRSNFIARQPTQRSSTLFSGYQAISWSAIQYSASPTWKRLSRGWRRRVEINKHNSEGTLLFVIILYPYLFCDATNRRKMRRHVYRCAGVAKFTCRVRNLADECRITWDKRDLHILVSESCDVLGRVVTAM